MNLSERMRAISKWCIFLIAMTLVGSASAQQWEEYSVLNQNQTLNFEKAVLMPFATTLLSPDPSLGTVTTGMSGGKLSINFYPVEGAVGTAEFIVEHFAFGFPPTQITSAYKIHIDSSHVTAVEDYFTVGVNDELVFLNVLGNDTLNGGSTLAISEVVASPIGVVEVSSSGDSLFYTPEADYVGMTYLSYVVCDEYGACDVTDVNIYVSPDGGFELVDTIFLSTHNQAAIVAFLPFPDFIVSEAPENGSLDTFNDQAWKTYTPDEDFVGIDKFTMTNDSLTRVVMVDVYHEDEPNSYAVNDVYYTRVDSTIVFDARLNDVKAFPIHSYSEPDKGELTVDALGVFTYTPDSDFVGAVEFEYGIKPLNGLEYGHVVIYIGDMAPDNTVTYHLVTPKNTPLVLNYQIPLSNYNLILTTVDADNGSLILHNDFQTLLLGCDEVSGYDLMVYTPDNDYTGDDAFEIEYCVVNGNCERIRVEIEVQDIGEFEDCHCIDDCVWPGDVNGNGQVDMADLLTLGWHVGETGEQRIYPDNSSWLGQYATDWEFEDQTTGYNSKYIDGNGDGVISELDTQVISDHYLLQHDLVPDIIGLKADYNFDIIPPSGPLDSGDLAVFEIAIGSEGNPVMNMHGIYFTLNIPTELYQFESVEIEFVDEGWLGHEAPNFELDIEPYHGRLDVGITRTNGTSVTGSGAIMVMTFIIVDDIAGFVPPGVILPFNITASNIGSLGSDGQMRSIQPVESTIYYRTPGNLNREAPLSINDKLHVYPNPIGEDRLKAHLNGDRIIESTEVYDMTGKLRLANTFDSKRVEIDISNLGSGSYILRVIGSDGVISRKFEVIR